MLKAYLHSKLMFSKPYILKADLYSKMEFSKPYIWFTEYMVYRTLLYLLNYPSNLRHQAVFKAKNDFRDYYFIFRKK